MRRHLLSAGDLTRDDAIHVLDTAVELLALAESDGHDEIRLLGGTR